jgi:catechol 2,3-dioxygenase-like lactoylglutathione lyase family enzyme
VIKKIDHVTMVIKNMEEALKSYENILHLKPEPGRPIGILPECRVAMLKTPEGARIEFIEPKNGVDTRFSRFLKERGEGVFGLSIFVEDFDGEVKFLKDKGVKVEADYQAAIHPGHPFRIAWVPPEEGHGVWLEFVDSTALPPGIR